MIRILENAWFDRLVIFVIIVNSIFLGLIDYTWTIQSGPKPLGNIIADQSEIFFTIFFTFEFFIKIIALGLIFGDSCYLRNGWNWLDFTVVVTSLV